MPLYTVKGLDRNTGDRRIKTVEAADEEDAVMEAGFVVESVVSASPRNVPIRWAVLAGAVLVVIILVINISGRDTSNKSGLSDPQFRAQPSEQISTPPVPDPLPPEPDPTWRDIDNSAIAYLMMNQFVEDRLRSPSTASFPFDENTVKVMQLRDNRYYVRGAVDAQNAFGATVRSDYIGIIQQVSEDRWNLIKLKLEAR